MTTTERESRVPVTTRLRPAARQRNLDLAHQHSLPGAKVTEADVMRAALAVAYAHQPEFEKAIIRIRGEA